jgi:tRNA dimethylallyltransferase
MMEHGLFEEAKRLISLPQALSKVARQAVGYKELFDRLQGKMNLDEAVAQIQTRSRQLAKRQLTWFRNLEGIQAVPVAGTETSEELAARVIEIWFGNGGGG